MAILNVRSVPATSDQNSNSKPLIRMVYEEQTDKYCQSDTSVSENKDTLTSQVDTSPLFAEMFTLQYYSFDFKLMFVLCSSQF